MENFDCAVYKDLIQRYLSVFLDENRNDVTFVFTNSDEKLEAHKWILKAASPVFRSMFSGSYAETNEVKIDDITPKVFKLLLSGIYLNDIHSQVTEEQPARIYADLYNAAEKYDIKDIRELSKKFMVGNCRDNNTLFLLEKAKLFNLPDLENQCKEHFQKNTYAVLSKHLYQDLNDGLFHEFLDLENIAVKSEFDLCMALQAIVDNENLLDYSKCLSKIRFLTMNTTDILSCDLLSAEDKVAIISNIEAKKIQAIPKFSMPTHLSAENEPRKFFYVGLYRRRFFWTIIMLKSVKYEDYFEDYFKQMEILTDSRERTKTLIYESRNKIDEKGGHGTHDINHKLTKQIFSLL